MKGRPEQVPTPSPRTPPVGSPGLPVGAAAAALPQRRAVRERGRAAPPAALNTVPPLPRDPAGASLLIGRAGARDPARGEGREDAPAGPEATEPRTGAPSETLRREAAVLRLPARAPPRGDGVGLPLEWGDGQ